MSRDLRRAEAAFFQTHALSEEQFEAMKQMLTIFAQHLGKHVGCWQGANHNGDPPCVASAKEFVREMAGGRVSMRDAAKHVHLSPSYFCKLFRKATGVTFTEYVSRLRVEKAKSLLQNPLARVSEVGYACGFEAIPHFNEVFRKYVAQSPTEYRKSLQSEFSI